jgi:hypothetical protein
VEVKKVIEQNLKAMHRNAAERFLVYRDSDVALILLINTPLIVKIYSGLETLSML